MTLELTDKVEELVNKYDSSNNDATLIELGKLLTDELLRNTQDNTEKFDVNVES